MNVRESQSRALEQGTLFLVSYPVVDDVLEHDALGIVEVVEELLVEDEGDAGDLLDVALRLRVTVYEVDSDRDRQLAPELFPPETLEEVGIFSHFS